MSLNQYLPFTLQVPFLPPPVPGHQQQEDLRTPSLAPPPSLTITVTPLALLSEQDSRQEGVLLPILPGNPVYLGASAPTAEQSSLRRDSGTPQGNELEV